MSHLIRVLCFFVFSGEAFADTTNDEIVALVLGGGGARGGAHFGVLNQLEAHGVYPGIFIRAL